MRRVRPEILAERAGTKADEQARIERLRAARAKLVNKVELARRMMEANVERLTRARERQRV